MQKVAGPWQFAAALLVMGLVFLTVPRAAPVLGLVLILGALYGLEDEAAAAGRPGPLADLGVKL